MATVTLRTEITVVYIVTIMATTAGLRRFHLAIHRALVTLVAVEDVLVRTGQLEIGLVMIEIPRFPTAHVMALLAFRAQTTLMDLFVVFCMTGETFRFGILKGGTGVTLLAFHQSMSSQ